MPIVVSRATGEIVSKPELTQADRDRAWEAVVRAFAKRHPELLVQQPPAQEGGEDNAYCGIPENRGDHQKAGTYPG